MEKKNPFSFHNYDNRGKLFSKLSRRHLLSNNYFGKKTANSLEVKENPKKTLKLPSIPSLHTSGLQPVILFMTCFLSLCPFFSIHLIQESKIVLELLRAASSWDPPCIERQSFRRYCPMLWATHSNQYQSFPDDLKHLWHTCQISPFPPDYSFLYIP